MGCHALLQGIFLTQESNQGLLHCRQSLYQLSYQGSVLYIVVMDREAWSVPVRPAITLESRYTG